MQSSRCGANQYGPSDRLQLPPPHAPAVSRCRAHSIGFTGERPTEPRWLEVLAGVLVFVLTAGCSEPTEIEAGRDNAAARQPQRSAAPAGGGGFEDMDDGVPFANPLRSRALCLAS